MTINTEQAPALSVYGEHASRLASLTRARPSLVPRLLYAPRSAVHAIAAWLFFSERADQSEDTVAQIIDTTNPRLLLREAIPSAPPRLYRALNRAGDRVERRDFYTLLAGLVGGPLGDLLLSAGPLNITRLQIADKVMRCDESIIRLFRDEVLPESLSVIKAAQALTTWLQAYDLPITEKLRMVPPKARVPAVRKVFDEALSSLSAPPAPFRVALPFRIVMTVSELQAIGRQYKNCLGHPDYASSGPFETLDGRTIYVTAEEPAILAALQRVGPDLWHLQEIKGPENAPVDEEARSSLVGMLRGAGVVLVEESPEQALRTLTYWTHRNRDGDLVEDNEDVAGAIDELVDL